MVVMLYTISEFCSGITGLDVKKSYKTWDFFFSILEMNWISQNPRIWEPISVFDIWTRMLEHAYKL